MKKGVKAYNNLMNGLAMEYNTIGTSFTEDPERRNNWNLRDMVSEVQYTLDIYTDPNCIYWQDAQDDEEYNKIYKGDIANMRKFIRTYKKEALTMQCTDGHCSKYD